MNEFHKLKMFYVFFRNKLKMAILRGVFMRSQFFFLNKLYL